MATRHILRRPAVEAATGKSRSEIYRAMARGEFPRPVRLGLKSVGWYSDEIEAWIAARPRADAEGAAR